MHRSKTNIKLKKSGIKFRKSGAKKLLCAMSALALIATSGILIHNNRPEEVDATTGLAPAGSTPSNVTCTTPGVRGVGSCDVDVSTLPGTTGLSGKLTFVLGDSGEFSPPDAGSIIPSWANNPSGLEANAVTSGGLWDSDIGATIPGITGNGTLAIPNSILVDGVGSPIPVTQTRSGNALSYISGSVDIIIPNTVIFVGEGSGGSPNVSVQFEDGGTEPLTIWSGSLNIESTRLTTIEFPGRLTRVGQPSSWTKHLTNVTFNEGSYPLVISQGGLSVGAGSVNANLVGASITFPSNTILIADNAFVNAGITNITFTPSGSNPLNIGSGAFSCTNLADTITFPSNLASIGEYAFWNNPSNYPCASGITDSIGLTSVVFTNSLSIAGVSDEAFRPNTSFADSCSDGSTEQAIIEFIGPDGVTPIYTTNDFGCEAYTNGPSTSALETYTQNGWKLNGWHLMQNLSNTALSFPWTPFTGAVAVDDLLVYGDWTELQSVAVSLPVGTAKVGETIDVTVVAKYADGSQVDVTGQISSLTSADIATGNADKVNGNQVTFVQASTHEICATFQGVTGCSNIQVIPADVGAPDTGVLGVLEILGADEVDVTGAARRAAFGIFAVIAVLAVASAVFIGRKIYKKD